MSEKFRLEHNSVFKIHFTQNASMLIIDSIGPSIILRSIFITVCIIK